MTHIEQAIRDAVEKGGWKPRYVPRDWFATSLHELNGIAWLDENGHWQKTLYAEVFLDPLFWQTLGKARMWEQYEDTGYFQADETPIEDLSWKVFWHRFIDHLAEGKDAESFFSSLN